MLELGPQDQATGKLAKSGKILISDPFHSILHNQHQIWEQLIYSMTAFEKFGFLNIFGGPGT